jgi:hypothetical protein
MAAGPGVLGGYEHAPDWRCFSVRPFLLGTPGVRRVSAAHLPSAEVCLFLCTLLFPSVVRIEISACRLSDV